jgi:hypothetical protein
MKLSDHVEEAFCGIFFLEDFKSLLRAMTLNGQFGLSCGN